MYKIIILIGIVFFSNLAKSQENKSFSSLIEVLDYVKLNNYSLQNADLQYKLAELTHRTAIANVFNPRIPSSFQMIDNAKQQVSFIPAEAFGGAKGAFREITMGQEYVSTLSIQPQFDIINMANISQVKSSKINKELTENQNKINEQKIYEQIDAVYFNILSFEAQKELISENILIAQKILTITKSRFEEGISRKQEVNEAEANFISLQDKLSQLEINLQMQYQNLSLFFENKIKPQLSENVWNFEELSEIAAAHNDLQVKNIDLQMRLAKQELRVYKYQNFPSLSFISSFNYQNLSNDNFFYRNSNWVDFYFVGLKLSWDFPTTVSKFSTIKNKQIQVKILQNNQEHIQRENDVKNEQMTMEYTKSYSQSQNLKKIYELKKDTYEKNYNQYVENILPLDKLLISQNDMLISKLNLILSLANTGFNKNKIEINNKF